MGSEGCARIETIDLVRKTSPHHPNARMRLRARMGICTLEDDNRPNNIRIGQWLMRGKACEQKEPSKTFMKDSRYFKNL